MSEQDNIKKVISTNLAKISIQAAMSPILLTVYEGWSIKRLSQFFLKHNISGSPVIAADDELVGVVTQSDILSFENTDPDEQQIKKLIREYCGPFSKEADDIELARIQQKANEYCTVNQIMTRSVLAIEIQNNLAQAYKEMVKQNVHRLFVTQRGVLIGVITAMDILRCLERQ
jgi:predicted transcriptional regulator